jgi:F-type H+-transporting ATPase subunit b
MWKVVFSQVAKAMLDRDTRASAAIQSAEARERRGGESTRGRRDGARRGSGQGGEAARGFARAGRGARARDPRRAKVQGDALIENARAAIRTEQEKAIASIRGAVVDLSLHAASRVIGRNVGSEDDRRMVHELVSAAEAGKK